MYRYLFEMIEILVKFSFKFRNNKFKLNKLKINSIKKYTKYMWL